MTSAFEESTIDKPRHENIRCTENLALISYQRPISTNESSPPRVLP
jgi:hypothetical protein